VLVLYANPVDGSFGAALHAAVLTALNRRGHEVDDCDLYAERFDPILDREDRLVYDHAPQNRRNVAPYVDRLLWAEGLVAIFPVWNLGFPAILKGYFDRVFLPGVTFEIQPNGSVATRLHNVRNLAAVCTYGASRLQCAVLGDAPRHYIKRSVKALCKPGAACSYQALYDLNTSKEADRSHFLKRVSDHFTGW
jgi:putative NADPH-quinone reductase